MGDVVEPIVFVCPANGFAGDDLATMRDPENLLPPTVASMPDLSNATPQSSRMALGRSLLGIGAKDHLTLVVPQRFYVHQQGGGGDRHMYASRTRFLPDSLAPHFDIGAWPVGAPAVDRIPGAVASLDLAARMRAMWK